MLKVYGFAVSNYFNMVRLALLEKGASFQSVKVFPSQEAEFLARSPVGKVPCIETGHGFLSETTVILDYIEETQSGRRLLPTDAYQRARVRQAVKMMELYVELPARRLYPGVFFGGSNADLTVQEVGPVLRKGMAGLGRVLQCGSWLMGEEFTLADCVAAFTFPLAGAVAKKVYGWDMVPEVPGLAEALGRINALPSVQQLNAESRAEMAEFQARMAKR
jgi:glutathione S-transferase